MQQIKIHLKYYKIQQKYSKKKVSRKWIVRFFQRISFCGLWVKYSSGTS